ASYGSIFAYYRDANKSSGIDYTRSKPDNLLAIKNYSFEESVALGLTTVVDVKLDGIERKILTTMVENSSNDDFDHYLGLFENWMISCDKNYPKTNSNLYTFFEDPAYKELTNYYEKSFENILSFYIDSLFQIKDNNFTSQLFTYAFCSLNKDIHGGLLLEAKEDWRKNSYTNSGSYIAPTPEYITRQYAKKILKKQEKKLEHIHLNQINDNHEVFHVNPNPIQIGNELSITITLNKSQLSNVQKMDLTGRVIEVLAKNYTSLFQEKKVF